jgi:hypothetical protein
MILGALDIIISLSCYDLSLPATFLLRLLHLGLELVNLRRNGQHGTNMENRSISPPSSCSRSSPGFLKFESPLVCCARQRDTRAYWLDLSVHFLFYKGQPTINGQNSLVSVLLQEHWTNQLVDGGIIVQTSKLLGALDQSSGSVPLRSVSLTFWTPLFSCCCDSSFCRASTVV